jgi:hypothetical protein
MRAGMTSTGFGIFFSCPRGPTIKITQNDPTIAALCRIKPAQSREVTALISRRTIFGLQARRKLAFLPTDNRSPKIRPRPKICPQGTFPKVR